MGPIVLAQRYAFEWDGASRRARVLDIFPKKSLYGGFNTVGFRPMCLPCVNLFLGSKATRPYLLFECLA